MTSPLTPTIEAALLDQTESALREFTTVGMNCGISKGQMAMMLRTMADELCPPIVIPQTMTVQ